MVTQDEIIGLLQDAHYMLTGLYGEGDSTYEKIIERIQAEGIAPPDGRVIVPIEPDEPNCDVALYTKESL